MPIITPQLKDKLLIQLLSADSIRTTFTFSPEMEEELGMTSDMAQMIIKQFEEMGLLKATFFSNPFGARITLNAKAHDVYSHGGFTAQEEILKANIEKLDLQLQYLTKQLGPDYLDTASKISSIGSAIMSALPLFKF